ncbi:MAG: IS200/IS605 family element transposase accessory protein TnpB [Pyrinomonadaceae bacterium]|nr:IS200/IS605 family element transposase accessory protein TnpB [Pyrinomonadaceae bacterium]
MKLIAQVKLLPSKAQAQALKDTLELANAACDWISELAWDAQVFKQYKLHKLAYHDARHTFNLSAQVIVRCIAKVADAYKLDKKTKRTFKPHGAIAFDDRILSWQTDKQGASIWTVAGRQKIPYTCGERQKRLLESRIGETDLVFRKGKFYLLAVCEVPEPTPGDVDDVLGVDFGVINIATDSDGQTFSGAEVEQVRQKRATQRQILQHKASRQSQSGKRPRSIHRLIKRLSGHERNFKSHTNHCISKQLVRKAQDSDRSIAIEDLKGIRRRPRFGRRERARMSSWGFAQLRQFLTYKAKLGGVQLIFVDPRNTSRTCSACGHCAKENRKSQAEFVCVSCGHSLNADFNAAINISRVASVNTPQVSERTASVSA